LRSESEAKSSSFCAKRSDANSHCEFGALLNPLR
jgi:hypothetical protein